MKRWWTPRPGRRLALLLPVLAWAAVAAAALSVPRSTAPAPSRPTSTAVVSVPVDVERDAHDGEVDVDITAEVHIDGHGPFELEIDTGSSSSSLTRKVLDAIGAKRTGASASFSTANGQDRDAHYYRIRSWSMGDATLQPDALVTDLPGDYSGDDGLLGADQLDRFQSVTIDWAAGRMLLGPQASD